ncbi:MAG: ComEC/Rec2 family competence protein [Solirubrobacteraceae bacterium]
MPTVPRTQDVPANRLTAEDFLASIRARDLVHFVVNVGDGDTQMLLLPEEDGKRKAIVVDVVNGGKLENLIYALRQAAVLRDEAGVLALVVATHPHYDHISGMAGFLASHSALIDEFWEPGYYLPTSTYFKMMDTLARLGDVAHSQPTSGTTRYIDQVKITVLAPGIGLRNRYDSYGIDVNNSSIALKIDFPARRYYRREDDGSYAKLPSGTSLVLGADAQTASWSQVMVDFPQLEAKKTAVAEALRQARGAEPLSAHVFKVPHHASKHGLNLELVEEINPAISLVSSVREGGSYNFPHTVALEALREGLEPTAQKGAAHQPDYELGIHFTSGRDDADAELGTIAVVLGPGARKREVWRFGDSVSDPIDLTNARRFQ